MGTSLGEILHFVSLPADPEETDTKPSYIFATRLEPPSGPRAPTTQSPSGIQQILVLPKVQKACVLCNGTLSFYTLPELSPAFNNTTVPNCTWVGGVDLDNYDGADESGVVVMICVKMKTRLVRLRDEARRVKDIEYPGCLTSLRRGNFACVADSKSYALLDVENQQKISLFPISSLDDNAAGGKIEDLSTSAASPGRSASATRPASGEGAQSGGHGRNTSLGAFVGGIGRRSDSSRSRSRERSLMDTPEPALQDLSQQPLQSRPDPAPETHLSSSQSQENQEKPLPPPPPRSSSLRPPAPSKPVMPLRPHICSPTPNEFMLSTGTSPSEAGVGIFVNLDGDVVRGTLEFARYPSSVVLDSNVASSNQSFQPNESDQDGFVLALIPPLENSEKQGYVEIQRWDANAPSQKESLHVPSLSQKDKEDDALPLSNGSGLRQIKKSVPVQFSKVCNMLRGERVRLKDLASSTRENLRALSSADSKSDRAKEEIAFGQRLGQMQSDVALWSGSAIWLAVRNPLATRLEAKIQLILESTPLSSPLDRSALIQIVSSIRGLEATSETDFLSLEYVRQKLGLLLFSDLLRRFTSGMEIATPDLRITEGLLTESGLDPRVVLAMVPPLCEEIVETTSGIWIHAGLVSILEDLEPLIKMFLTKDITLDILALLKRYLYAWRQRKGFGSIADEKEVFHSVDAALLVVLLRQEDAVRKQGNMPSSERAELYALVDSGLDCFERAIQILEHHNQLYLLSRLYQSRRIARKVLDTWKRIIEGEKNVGGGLVDGENEVRKYLVNVKDTAIVDEYGTWLAERNPALGVQVFTNENSRVKWEPHQVVMLLRRRAPDSVKEYLEHLVFGKKHTQYANDLISYYLDSVLAVLESSEDAHVLLAQSYETYRALRPPKPTYREFIIENAVPFPWWHDRLRLLELIGGSHGAEFSYDVDQVLSRIEPFEQDLVPESIILDGRQGRHQQAIRLLTHGLGDYHTAINYCLLGGASIFHPTQGSPSQILKPSEDEQSRLFSYLLTEFLRIEDPSDRLERTSELLSRFSLQYDMHNVLELIPESWSVELLSGFLVSSVRRLVSEKNEASVVRALSGAENLQIAARFVEKCVEVGPQVETIGGDGDV